MPRPKAGKKTRKQTVSKLGELVGPGKELVPSDVPTLRAALQKGILIKERKLIEEESDLKDVHVGDICRELAPSILSQWLKSNPKFSPPVVVQEASLARRLESLWKRAEEVAWGRAPKKEKQKVLDILDRLLDVTSCRHTILLCHEAGSGCSDEKACKNGAHIKCDCPLPKKVPTMELRWLAAQRTKMGEKADMMMLGVDKEETERQAKTAKRKAETEEAAFKRRKKQEEEEAMLLEQQEASNCFECEEGEVAEIEEIEAFRPSLAIQKEEQKEAKLLVETLLSEKLGDKANLVVRYLGWQELKRNTMPIPNTAKASIRYITLHL